MEKQNAKVGFSCPRENGTEMIMLYKLKDYVLETEIHERKSAD